MLSGTYGHRRWGGLSTQLGHWILYLMQSVIRTYYNDGFVTNSSTLHELPKGSPHNHLPEYILNQHPTEQHDSCMLISNSYTLPGRAHRSACIGTVCVLQVEAIVSFRKARKGSYEPDIYISLLCGIPLTFLQKNGGICQHIPLDWNPLP